MKRNDLWTRLTALCLAVLMVPIFTGCRNAPPTNAPNRPTARFDVFDPNTGRKLATAEDNSGQTALGHGQSFDTTKAKLVEALTAAAEKATPTNGMTLLSLGRSAAVAANVARINELTVKRKETAQAALAALDAGLEQDYVKLTQEVVKLGKDVAELIAQGQRADDSGDNKALDLLLLTTAPGQKEMITALAATGGTVLASEHGNRASFSETTKESFEDTTTTEDIRIGAETIAALAKLDAEVAIAKLTAAGKPTTTKPGTATGGTTDPRPVPAPVDGFTCTPKFNPNHAQTKTTARGQSTAKFAGTDDKFRYIGNRKLGQGTFTYFIPADRPKLAATEARFGTKVYCPDIQWADTQNRQRAVFTDPVPDGPGLAVCKYVDGSTEAFRIEDGNGAQNTTTAPFVANAGAGDVPGEDDLFDGGLPPPNDDLINDGGGTTNAVSNAVIRAASPRSITLAPAINARAVRVQVVHSRNGYAPAFDVSGVKGVGVANGFQWVNLKWNASGVYDAGKPLAQYPEGKRGPAVWLVSAKAGMGGWPFYADGNFVVTAAGQYVPKG